MRKPAAAIGIVLTVLLLAGCSSADGGESDAAAPTVTTEAVNEESNVEVPDVIGMTVLQARAAIVGAGFTFSTVPGAADDWVVQTQDRTVPSPVGSAVFVTAADPAPDPPAPAPVAPEPPASHVISEQARHVLDVNLGAGFAAAPAIKEQYCTMSDAALASTAGVVVGLYRDVVEADVIAYVNEVCGR